MKINKFTDVDVGNLVRINERYYENHKPKINTTDILEVVKVYYYLGEINVKVFGTELYYYLRISDKPVKTKTVVCTKCGYKLEYTGEDIRTVHYTDISGCGDTSNTIVCPRASCAEVISVSHWSSRY